MAQPRKLHDRYFKQAKAEGYAARSAYKLLEINEKRGLLHRGDRVLDLGCSPGSWLQVVAKIIGTDGVGVGVDLKDVETPFPPNIFTLVADAFTIDPAILRGESKRPFDVVLSDMAPDTTGHGDDFLSVRLCRRVLEICPSLLRRNGNLCMKVLEGEEFPTLLRETRAMFFDCGASKPAASREVSRETFIWAKGFKGAATLRA